MHGFSPSSLWSTWVYSVSLDHKRHIYLTPSKTMSKDADLLETIRRMKDVVSNMKHDSPTTRSDLVIDEGLLTSYFTSDVLSLPAAPNPEPMGVSMAYWYCKKYERTHMLDPFTLGGERLLGAMLAGCKYTGSSTYYPLHKSYREIIDTYATTKDQGSKYVVLRDSYRDVLSRTADVDIIFAHIPVWEDHCLVLSRIWKATNEGAMVVLHYSSDNERHVDDIQRLIRSLKGLGSNPDTRRFPSGEQVILMTRQHRATLKGTIKKAAVSKSRSGRRAYTIPESCVYLATARYVDTFQTDTYKHVYTGDSATTLDFARVLGNKLTIYGNTDTYASKQASALYMTKVQAGSIPLAGTMYTEDPVLRPHIQDVVDATLSRKGPSRVWLETQNIVYLECLMDRWPGTFFLVCSWGILPPHNRYISYKMEDKSSTLDSMADKYGQPNDAILRVR